MAYIETNEYGAWGPELPDETDVFEIDKEEVQMATEEEDPIETPFIDPRTGNSFGTYSDDEIIVDMADTMAKATTFELPYEDVPKVNESLNQAVEADPTMKEVRDGTFQIMYDELTMSRQASRANDLHFLHLQTGDEAYRQEALKIQEEMAKQAESMPLSENLGHVKKIAKYSAGAVGYMSRNYQETAKKAPYGPMRMAATAAMYSRQQMIGDIYGKLYGYVDEETGVTIDPEVAKQVATVAGALSGTSEDLGIVLEAMPISIPGAGLRILTAALSVGGEAGTEGLQQVIENFATHYAVNQSLEKAGLETRELTADVLLADVGEAAAGGAYGAIGLAGAGAAGRGTYNVTSGLVEKKLQKSQEAADQKTAQRVEEEAQRREAAEEQARTAQLNEDKHKPTAPSVDQEGMPNESAELLDDEWIDAQENANVRNTTITDGELEESVLLDDDQAVEEWLDEKDAQIDASFSDEEIELGADLREVLPDEAQASAIEDILTAVAGAFGMTTGEYIRQKNLQIQRREEQFGTDRQSAEVLIENGQNIITAFGAADVSSIAHEIAHVFRQDITGEALQTLENWAGVVDGQWTAQQEEQFARAFERYLADGKAPNAQLQNVFAQFARWMKDIYKAIKNSDIDVNMTDEVRGVFDGLLAGDRQAKSQLSSVHQDGLRLFQQQTRPPTQEEIDARYQVLVSQAERKYKRKALSKEAEKRLNSIVTPQQRKKMTPRQLYRAQVKALRMVMQDAFDTGNKVGVEQARNEMKLVMLRERNRRKMRERVRRIDKRILRLVEKAQPYGGKKKKSAFELQVTKLMEGLHAELKNFKGLTRRQLNDHLNARHANMPDPNNLSELDILVNTYLDLKIRAESVQGAKAFTDYHNILRAFLVDARRQSPFMQTARQAALLIEENLGDIIGQGRDLDNEIKKYGSAQNAYKAKPGRRTKRERIQSYSLLSRYIEGWNGLLDIVTSYAPSEQAASVIKEALDFFNNRQQRDKEIREADIAIRDSQAQQMGLLEPDQSLADLGTAQRNKIEARIFRKMGQDLKKVHDVYLGVNNKYNMAQVRQVWMYMQDPSLTNRLENMGIDDAVRARIEEILAENPADLAMAQWMLERFQSDFEYDRNNAVYQRVYGTDLNRLPNYVPIRSEWYQNNYQQMKNEGEILPQFAMDQAMRHNPESAGSLMERAENADNSALIIDGDNALYMGWQRELAHFRNYAEKVRLANSFMKNNDFRRAVVSEHGERFYSLLERHLSDISANGTSSAYIYPWLDRLRSAWVTSNIGLSVGVMMKQGISTVNYWQHIPTKDYAKGMIKFWSDPKKHFAEMQEIWNSEYLESRRFTGLERDMLTSRLDTTEFKRFKLNPTFNNLLTLNVRLGDNAAIAIGGWMLYNHFKNSTNHRFGRRLSHTEALQEMSRLSEQTQQASALEEQAAIQRGGSIAKFGTTFSTGPIQAIRQETKAIRDYAAGRISHGQFIKTMFIYHILVPTLYMGASSLISGDDLDDFYRRLPATWLGGPVSSAYSVGRSIYNGIMRAFGLKYYQGNGVSHELVMDIVKVIENTMDGEFDLDDTAGAIQSGMIISGRTAPVQRVTRMGENLVQGDLSGTIFGTKPED